jgi:hypothetical protein
MTILEWINKESFQYKKLNERPWGSYEVGVSNDNGQTWAGFPRTFGFGFTEKEAFEIVLKETIENHNLHDQLKQWLGTEKFLDLLSHK